jgi:hypothetical protein
MNMRKLKKSGKDVLWAAALIAVASAPVVVASVPRSNQITNDTAIYQNLHEIRLAKIKSLDFDSDISRLSAQEKRHRDAVPMRVSAPMDRVLKTPYHPGGSKSSEQLKQRHYHRSRTR